MNKSDIIYFRGINGLRFIAAFCVVITHIELLKPSFGFETIWHNPVIFNLGSLGVYFFFVLSGFLITFLLLVEKEKFERIDVKRFYLRRVLRIWPLYYLIIILGFVVLPLLDVVKISYLQTSFEQNYITNLLLYIFMLPNAALSFLAAVPHIGQLWSIGVEEQFYLLWPLLINKSSKPIKAISSVLILVIAVKAIYVLLGQYYSNEAWYNPIKLFLAMSKFECMAIGGIGAYLVQKNKESILTFLKHPALFIAGIISIPILIFYTPDFLQDGVHLIYGVIFLLIIIQVIGNLRINTFLEFKWINYLGKISYGIYMYHFMLIPFVLFTVKNLLGNQNSILNNILIYSSSVILTAFISYLSFNYFENYFIQIKTKLAKIKSKS
ncbi:MAG: acyltransferase family protein [Bacteroidia bacterium]